VQRLSRLSQTAELGFASRVFPRWKENDMPAKSAAQQKAAGAALSAKRGDTPKRELRGASKSVEKSMSESELKKMASTSRKGKVEHKNKI
jgi:hypothetical protein